MDWKREKVGPIKSFPDAFISIFLFSISIFWFEEISSQMVAVVCLWWAVVTICRLLSIWASVVWLLFWGLWRPPPHRPQSTAPWLSQASHQSVLRQASTLDTGHFWPNFSEKWWNLTIFSKFGPKVQKMVSCKEYIPMLSTLDTSSWHPSQKLWNL